MGYQPSMDFRMQLQSAMNDSSNPGEIADMLIWIARQMDIGNLDYHDIRRIATDVKKQQSYDYSDAV